MQPGVEDWIADGGAHADVLNKQRDCGIGGEGSAAASLTNDQWEDLWNWAGPEGNRIAREMGEDAFNDVFTLAEQEDGIEKVVTGLRRKMWESEDEESGDEEEKMDVDVAKVAVEKVPEVVRRMQREGVDESRSAMPLEALLRFTSTGAEPPAVGGVR